eukprot:jgi/Tetstr1/460815/TSEL_000569.t1
MEQQGEQQQRGVLLYYKYVDLDAEERQELAGWVQALCQRLALVGRVRVALDGLNVTLGGALSRLQEHIEAVKTHPVVAGVDIDFKLAPFNGPVSKQASQETGFQDLKVTVCTELVTLGPRAAGVRATQGGAHLSPQEFHAALVERRADGADTVLIDTRNCYETRIGRFRAPGIALEDPCTRQFSDFPAWADANAERLRGKRVMMYCTGGVRCERASAYLRAKGDGFQDVVQLSGGIQRYLEAFPKDGFFHGKNFVFDERLAVGGGRHDGGNDANEQRRVVGSCMRCAAATEDYGPRLRCPRCRLLLLICADCAAAHRDLPLCELCAAAETILTSGGVRRKLRVLCLHGFRQSSRKLQGRTAALRKKLGETAELVYADAPHRLPFWYKPAEGGGTLDQLPPPSGQPQRAWLVTPETLQCIRQQEGTGQAGWQPAPAHCAEGQHQRETEGWAASWRELARALREDGPFDGVMGFSQGAGVAAHLCALQHLVGHRAELERGGLNAAAAVEEWDEACALLGYPVAPSQRIADLLQALPPISLPSLHVYSTSGLDAQVPPSESAALAASFDAAARTVVTHDSGHVVPCSRPFVSRYRAFLAGRGQPGRHDAEALRVLVEETEPAPPVPR